jgi:hypothetical protein
MQNKVGEPGYINASKISVPGTYAGHCKLKLPISYATLRKNSRSKKSMKGRQHSGR